MKLIYRKIIFVTLITLSVGFLSGLVTADAIPTWYANLNKPSFSPPNWVFGPVWTVLYIMMGIAGGIAWEKQKSKTPMALYSAQLVLNGLWTIIFFGLKNPGLAFAEIILLWLMILATIYYFYKTSKLSAYLLVPYVLWVTFASILNASIVILN